MPDPEVESEDDDGEPYDPYKHRPEKRNVSDFGALANLLKSAAGTGLFAMPHAYVYVGMALGITGTVVMGFLITVSLQMLMRTHHNVCIRARRPKLQYDQVAALTLTSGVLKNRVSPEIAALIVDIAILSCYVGIGAVYVVFISEAVQECIDTEKYISQAYYSLILFPLFLAVNMVKSIHALAPISIIGNLFLLIAMIIGFVYALKDGVSGDWVMVEYDTKHYPIFLGTVFFSLCSPGLILTIEHSMKRPWNYTKPCGILNCGMLLLVMLYVIVGAVGYYRWGENSLGNFIRNHPQLDAATLTALVMQILAMFLTYSLQCYMPISILHCEYATKSIQEGYLKGTPYLWGLIVRLGVTVVTCILAVTIPRLDLFISFAGAVCVATLGSLLPVILYVITHWGKFGRFYWKLILSLCVLAVGFAAMLCSTITSVAAITWYVTH